VPAKRNNKNKSTAKKATAKKATARSRAKTSTGKTMSTRTTRTKMSTTKTSASRPPKTAERSSTRTASGRRGDFIIIDSAQVGSPSREGEILKVIEGETSVSYQVRWRDGHETLITPAPGVARVVRT
jgi:hypothetical protein